MTGAPSLLAATTLARRTIVISARRGGIAGRLRELWEYRELFYFLVWRDVKVRYAQSVLGLGWAIIQPLVPMVIFTVVFGRVAGIQSDGIEYAVFSLAGLVPWTYFSNALNDAGGSLVKEVNMLSKIYFPRIIIPLTSVLGRLIDFGISLVVLLVVMLAYGYVPGPTALFGPVFIAITMMTAAGLGMWLSALAVQYRDVRYALPFAVQLLMYAAPIVYPASLVPDDLRYAYAINPMVGVVEGLRSALVGLRPIPWDLVAIGAAAAALMLLAGTRYFVRKESVFADVA